MKQSRRQFIQSAATKIATWSPLLSVLGLRFCRYATRIPEWRGWIEWCGQCVGFVGRDGRICWMWNLVLLIALFPAMAFAGDAALIVSGGRLYLSQGNGTVATDIGPSSLLQNVHYMPGETPPDEPPDDEPPESNRVQQVRVYSRDVNDAGNAPVVVAVIGALSRQDLSGKGKEAWDAATSVTFSAIGPPKNTAWQKWKQDVEALAGDKFDKQFFQDVQAGISAAYDLSQETLSDLLDEVDDGTKPETASARMFARYGQAWDWTKIIELIFAILQLLRDLGILG